MIRFVTIIFIFISCLLDASEKTNYKNVDLNKAIKFFYDESTKDSAIYYAQRVLTSNADKESIILSSIVFTAAICECGKYDSAYFILRQIDSTYCLSKPELAPWYFAISGLVQFRLNNYDNAYKYLLNAIAVSKQPDYCGQAFCERLLGRICMNMGDYAKSIEWLDESTRHFQKAGAIKSVFINEKIIGRYYSLTNDNSNALKHFNNALYGLKRFNDSIQLYYVYLNISDYYIQQNIFSLALKYTDTCLIIAKKYNNKFLEAQSLLNKGEIKLKQKDYLIALYYFNNTNSLLINSNEIRTIFITYLRISEALQGLKRWHEASIALKSANSIAEKSKRKELLRLSHCGLSKFYENTHLPDSALVHLKLAIIYKDSIYNQDVIIKKSFYEIRSGIEQRDKQIAIKDKEIINQNAKRNYILFAFVFLLTILVLLYLYTRSKHKNQLLTADITGQERERVRFARELHDSIGGNLAAVKLNLSNCRNNVNPNLDEIVEIVDQTWKEVRSISHNLMPPMFQEVNFDEVIADYVTKISSINNLIIEYQNISPHIWQTVGIDSQLEIYRIVQEALTNIVKHASATKVYVQFAQHETQLNLIIEDNGIGFNTSMKKEGIGLRNIKQRVEYLNGTIEIDSQISKGTTLNILLALN